MKNTIRYLSFRYLTLNLNRTIVSVIGVILSSAMLTAVFTLMISLQNVLYEDAFKKYGNWQVEFFDCTQKQTQFIKQYFPGNEVMYSQDLGFSKLEESNSRFMPYLFISQFNDLLWQGKSGFAGYCLCRFHGVFHFCLQINGLEYGLREFKGTGCRHHHHGYFMPVLNVIV